MRTSKRLAGVLFALCMAIAGITTASAAVLFSDTGNSFWSSSANPYPIEFGGHADGWGPYQPLASVLVGGSNVQIGGFGVFGQAEQAGSLKFGIFDITDPFTFPIPTEYMSSSLAVGQAASATWYNVSTDVTLLAGHKYSLGVMALNHFAWGRTATDSSIQGGGLTLLAESGDAYVDTVVNNDVRTAFAGNPMRDGFADYSGYRTSLQVFSAGGGVPPIPEPSEWAMLLAGLMVVAFVAKRRGRRNI